MKGQKSETIIYMKKRKKRKVSVIKKSLREYFA